MAVIKNMMVRVGADFSGLISGSEKALGATQKWSGGTKRAMEEVSGSAAALEGAKSAILGIAGALGIGFSLSKVVQGLGACIEEGAGAQAAMAQFGQIFGPLQDEAEASLKGIAEQAGSTAYAMRGSFNQIAAFAKTSGMGTSDALALTERAMMAAADSAAFYDRSLEDVTDNLQSFLKGNYANDAALGVSCTETTRNAAANDLYGKSFKDLSEAQKQLTLLKMVEDANRLSGAMGQASRESGNWTTQVQKLNSQWKEFMSIIGKGLITVFTPVVQGLNWILGGLIKVGNAVGDILSNLFGIQFEDMTSTAIEGFEGMADAAEGAGDAAEDAGTAAEEAGNQSAAGSGKAAKAAKGAAAAMNQLLGFDKIIKLPSESGGGSGGSGGSGGGSGGGGGSKGAGGAETAAEAVGSGIQKATESVLDKTAHKVGDWAEKIKKLLGGIWDAFKDLIDALPDLKLPDIHLPDLTFAPDWSKTVEQQAGEAAKGINAQLSSIQIKPIIFATQNYETTINQIRDIGTETQKTDGFWDGLNKRIQQFNQDHPILSQGLKNIYENTGKVEQVIQNDITAFDHFRDSARNLVSGDGKGALEELNEGLKSLNSVKAAKLAVELTQQGWTTVSGWVNSLVDTTKDLVHQGVDLSKSGWKNVKDWVGDHLGGAVSKGIGLAKSGWNSVKSWVDSLTGGGVSKGVGLSRSRWSSVKSWVDANSGGNVSKTVSLAKARRWKQAGLKNYLGLNGTFGISLSVRRKLNSSDVFSSNMKLSFLDRLKNTVASWSIWPHAKGGIVNAATLFGNHLLGEDGREAIIPLERNAEWMDGWSRKAAAEIVRVLAQSGSMGGGEINITVPVMLDGRQVGESSVRYIRSEANRGNYVLEGAI